MRSSLLSGIALALLFASCGKPEIEDQAGVNPAGPNWTQSSVNGEKNFAKLINENAKAKAKLTPWAGYWWPYSSNGIAQATSGGSSPAGKYDAARGGTTQAQSWETKHHGSKVPGVQGWWGHCNGWTAASMLFAEPNADVKINGVTFGIADQKALLTEVGMEAGADYFGDRTESWTGSRNWDDTIPDQYFLVLTNYMGRLQRGVGIDRYTGDQVWNQPAIAYEFAYPKRSDYLGQDPAAPGVYRINVTGRLWWAEDGVSPSAQTPAFDFARWEEATDGHGTRVFTMRELSMEIWLDGPVEFGSDGKIIRSGDVIVTRSGSGFVGGKWKMDGCGVDCWPDYMWVPYSILTPTEYANAHVDMQWLTEHMLVPGGRDDPSVRPINPTPAPSVEPSSSPRPSPRPTMTSPPNPWPTPSPTRRFPWPRP